MPSVLQRGNVRHVDAEITSSVYMCLSHLTMEAEPLLHVKEEVHVDVLEVQLQVGAHDITWPAHGRVEEFALHYLLVSSRSEI
jgi:hypothetical protein